MPGLPSSSDSNVDTLAEVINDLLAKIDVLTTKLNSDAGVSDTDYETDFESSLDIEDVTGTAI